MRRECRCAAGPHSLGRHEGFCPVVTGRTWCEDCGRTYCVCRPRTRTPDPLALAAAWATPAKEWT